MHQLTGCVIIASCPCFSACGSCCNADNPRGNNCHFISSEHDSVPCRCPGSSRNNSRRIPDFIQRKQQGDCGGSCFQPVRSHQHTDVLQIIPRGVCQEPLLRTFVYQYALLHHDGLNRPQEQPQGICPGQLAPQQCLSRCYNLQVYSFRI